MAHVTISKISRLVQFLSLFLPVFCLSPVAQAQTCTAPIESALPVNVEGEIFDVMIDASCRYVYATNRALNRVEVYSLDSLSFEDPIQVGSQPTEMDTDLSGQVLYVVNSGGTDISFVDLNEGEEDFRIDVIGGGGEFLNPISIATARNGKIFLNASGRMIEIDSANFYTSTARSDYGHFGGTTQETRLEASGDRETIIAVEGDSSGGPVHRYISATDTFDKTVNLGWYINYVDLDHTGDHIAITRGGYLLDHALKQVGGLPGSGAKAVAVSADGGFAYTINYSNFLMVFDIETFLQVGQIDIGAEVRESNGHLSVSQDGTLVAVATDTGFSIVRVQGEPQVPTRKVVAFSSAQPALQSFLRFFNTDDTAYSVTVSLSDLSTGEVLAEWQSPEIQPHSAPQFPISTIETEADESFTIPDNYLVSVSSGMSGYFSHVLWKQADGTLTNLSTCEHGNTVENSILTHVHSSLLSTLYPSVIGLVNTGDSEASVALGIYDARNGTKLGTYMIAVPPGAGEMIPVSDIETDAGLIPAEGMFHYVVQAETEFSGYLQHLVNNVQAGVLTDMTNMCEMP